MRTLFFILTTLTCFYFYSCKNSERNLFTQINLIPLPSEIIEGKEIFTLDSSTIICFTKPELKNAADYLSVRIAYETGIILKVSSEHIAENSIFLDYKSETDSIDIYSLNIQKKNVSIEGVNPRSLMLGVQTFRQLTLPGEGSQIIIPCTEIFDYPKWKWRGMMMDVARHYFSKEEVKEFLDLMAYYKFNKFHWHLTDDQGWRIEIKRYPLLTDLGAWRKLNDHDKACLNRAEKEHDTTFLLPENKQKQENGKTLYGGYYTQDDIREIVEYASLLGIDVIPEIDMPGHSQSAIKAYPELSCFNSAEWGKDFSAPLCPGKDHTLEMCKNIYAEVFELFPYGYVHLGADEVEKINWERCSHCKARINQENLKDEKELHSWFVRQMEDFFHENGKKMIGWDEIVEGGLSPDATVMWWRTWTPHTLKTAIEQGNQVILTPNSHNYFDYQQTAKTLRELYEFDPVHKNIKGLNEDLILGIQANAWAEAIPSRERFQYMTTPRMLVLSEIAWNDDPYRQWDEFSPRLMAHFAYLDKYKINYRPLTIPDLHERNVFVGETLVEWNHPQNNMELRYSTDGTIPDRNSSLYETPFLIDNTTPFTIRMFRPDSSAADIINTVYVKEEYRKGIENEQAESGLRCIWHEGLFNRCDQIETAPLKNEYYIESITIPTAVGGKRGLIYTGYIYVSQKDIYTFHLGSDDGSKLFIHEELIIDNDGPHGPRTLSGQISLDEGLHPVKLYYFDMNNGGFLDLKLFNSDGLEIALDKEAFYY